MSPVISHPRSAAARHQSDELSPITITVDCPAKTNLTLEVGPAHDEWGGRHELDTTYCAIGVYDTVTATAKQPGAGILSGARRRLFGRLGLLTQRHAPQPCGTGPLRHGPGGRARAGCGVDHHQAHSRGCRTRRRFSRRRGDHAGGQSSLGAELAYRAPAHHCRHVGRGYAVLPDRWPCIRHRFRRTHHGYRPRQPR